MISIREFAVQHGCTAANIYKHIKAHSEELQDHVIKRGSKKFLDDFAQDYLSSLLTPKPTVTIADQELMDQINELRAKLFAMSEENKQLNNDLAAERTRNAELSSQQMLLEERSSTLQKERDNWQEQAAAYKTEAESYKALPFGFYRKKGNQR